MLPIVALFLLGPISTLGLEALQSHEGGPDVSLFVNATPAIGLGLGLALLVASGVYGLMCARLVDPRTGTLSAGFLVSWAAWRTGNMELLLRFEPGSGTLYRLCLEAIVVCTAAGAVALLIAGAARADHQPTHGDLPGPHFGSVHRIVRPPVAVAIVAGAAGALVVAHVVAFNPLRGQALMAGVLGSIAAGAVTRLVIRAWVNEEAPSAAPYAAIVVAAAVAPLIGLVLPGPSGLETAAVQGTLIGPLKVQPLDWAAGMLIGTPMGLAWAGAAVHKARDAESAPAR